MKNMTKDELETKIRESEAQLFQTKMKQATGQLSNTAMLWRIRKDIARMKSLQSAAVKGSK
jgi:ribosomal protein L29